LALVFAGCSSNTFALFIWLPPFLVDAGLDDASAGSLLALYAITGLPTSLIVPLLVARMQRPFPVGLLFTLMFAAGYAGLLMSPTTGTALWVWLAGLGQGTYSFALMMVNKRTRTTAGSGALSGFAQGVGYSRPAWARYSSGSCRSSPTPGCCPSRFWVHGLWSWSQDCS
uniref:CynX/NimT family MFS transporter n=1 Tax=Arthrobacter sp. 9E06 TaxID=2058890 RepID=UPI0034D392E1